MAQTDDKELVKAYWEAEPCAAQLAHAPPGTAPFYAEVGEAKDALEPYRIAFAGFQGTSGQDVLEVGIGLGVDFVRFARSGARAVGVDLTEAAVESARRLLALEGLAGTALASDAESLPFDDESFDIVYSWGVLHHTPDTSRAVNEVYRVLRPGGEARIMLYALDSWFALGVWLRQIARERKPMGVRTAVSRGLESPGTQAFTTREIKELFARFEQVDVTRVVTHYDRRVAGPLAAVGGRGWFHLIRARRGS
jgi:SAM-dependent methyltransferase